MGPRRDPALIGDTPRPGGTGNSDDGRRDSDGRRETQMDDEALRWTT